MPSWGLDEWFWAMFEPTPTWPNFDQLSMWIWANNDQIGLPRGQMSDFEHCLNWLGKFSVARNQLYMAELSGREVSCCTLHHFLKKLVIKVFVYFGMNLPKDGTNQLPKAGFDWIAPKVIFISRGAEGPGREILKCPPSVCLSVCHV